MVYTSNDNLNKNIIEKFEEEFKYSFDYYYNMRAVIITKHDFEVPLIIDPIIYVKDQMEFKIQKILTSFTYLMNIDDDIDDDIDDYLEQNEELFVIMDEV